MREILEMCIELDTRAAEIYRSMAVACDEQELAELFDQLAREEDAHVRWWTGLLESWEKGLIPDVITDTDAIRSKLAGIERDVTSTVPDDVESLTPHEMLELAVRLEFFMLDPLFAELIEFTEPARAGYHREAYSLHIERIIGAIESHPAMGETARFLARVLKRALKDNALLATYATRDPLTGLYNRRGMLGLLEQWLSWAHRYRRPLTVLLVDIDRFKAVNDTHGHAGGDEVLVDVARALEASTRDSDLIARYGGDEFAILAPEADAAEYPVLAERILTAVREIHCPVHGSDRLHVSVSIGGATLAPGTEVTSVTTDLLLAAADSSMYVAKAAGRDRAGEPLVVGMTAAADPV